MSGRAQRNNNDHGCADLGGIPAVHTVPLGYVGAGWDIVDGKLVIMVDPSVPDADRVRFVVAALDSAGCARGWSCGGVVTAYATKT